MAKKGRPKSVVICPDTGDPITELAWMQDPDKPGSNATLYRIRHRGNRKTISGTERADTIRRAREILCGLEAPEWRPDLPEDATFQIKKPDPLPDGALQEWIDTMEDATYSPDDEDYKNFRYLLKKYHENKPEKVRASTISEISAIIKADPDQAEKMLKLSKN